MSSATVYPAVNYGPSNSDLNHEYRNRAHITRSICSERFIDNGSGGMTGRVEPLLNRDLSNTTESLAKAYQPVGKKTSGGVTTDDENILNASLRKGTTSCADACLIAISTALTKQAFGNEIVLNDTALRAKLRREIRRHLNVVFGYDDGSNAVNAPTTNGNIETTNAKDTGHHGIENGGYLSVQLDDDQFDANTSGNIVTQYLLNSGRASQGATAVPQKFDFDNMDFTFLIKLTGQVKDADTGGSTLTNNPGNKKKIQSTLAR